MKTCPNCGFESEMNDTECMKCGIIFEKWEAAQAKKRRGKKAKTEKAQSRSPKTAKPLSSESVASQAKSDYLKSSKKQKKFIRCFNNKVLISIGLLIVFAIITIFLIQSKMIDNEKFDSAYRSIKSIQSGTNMGLNINEFESILKTLNKDIFLLRDLKLNKKERELLINYSEVFEIYMDSMILWKNKIKFRLEQNSGDGFTFGMPLNCFPLYPEIRKIVNKYNLAKKEVEITKVRYDEDLSSDDFRKFNIYVVNGNTIQKLWSIAELKYQQSK